MCQHFEHHINSLGICFWVSYENSTEKAHSAGSELTSTQSNLTNRGLLTVGDLSFGLYPGFRQNLGLNIGFNVGLNLCLKPNVKLLSRPGSTIILVFWPAVLVPNSKGNPFSRGAKHTGVGKFCDFWLKSPFQVNFLDQGQHNEKQPEDCWNRTLSHDINVVVFELVILRFVCAGWWIIRCLSYHFCGTLQLAASWPLSLEWLWAWLHVSITQLVQWLCDAWVKLKHVVA